MKSIYFLILLLAGSVAIAEEAKKEEEWQATNLTDEVIQKVQKAQFNYKKCVVDAMRKPENAKLESRNATDVVIRACEPVLAELRKVFTDAEVPGVIADRQLKKMRIQVTRNVLQELMYNEAAKKAGQP